MEGMERKRKCGEVIRCGASYGKWVEGIGRIGMKWKEWKGMGSEGKECKMSGINWKEQERMRSEGKKWEGMRWNEKNGK